MKTLEAGQVQEAGRRARTFNLVSLLDTLVLLVIVGLMVFKPRALVDHPVRSTYRTGPALLTLLVRELAFPPVTLSSASWFLAWGALVGIGLTSV